MKQVQCLVQSLYYRHIYGFVSILVYKTRRILLRACLHEGIAMLIYYSRPLACEIHIADKPSPLS